MIDALLTWFGLQKASMIGGFFGAMVSLKFIEGLNIWQRGTTVFAGTFASAYVTPIVVEWLAISAKMEGGAAFLIGLFGMSMAGAVMKAIPEVVEAARKKWLGS